jgi:hypothetical protein
MNASRMEIGIEDIKRKISLKGYRGGGANDAVEAF